MSVEVLVSKPATALAPAEAIMKEQLRPSSHGGKQNNHVKVSSGYPGQIVHYPMEANRNTSDVNGLGTDIQQHFDNTHIIYDNSTDTTYLRGRLLGKGGFARCYEILNLNTNKIYAGKIISKTRISKPHQKQKILREVQLQKNLKHRHVVEFINYFEDDSNVYIILENCSRKSLVHVLKHRKYLTEPEVRYYLRQLVAGVEYIHSNQIIHRDLKLGNMLLNNEMDLKLADFGLATKVDFAGEKKMTVCGTPNYIAPEVLQKKGHSFEADIWAVGCIMYALLVGRPPFETTTLKETYLRITENNYSFPSSLTTAAKNLIRKCLHPEPTSRPLLQEILADEFFVCGYLPHSLSPTCCTAMPKFPSRYASNRPMSYAAAREPTVDHLGQLGNAISQMHLDSRSENLLEEKELEDIEKKSPQHSRTHIENSVQTRDTHKNGNNSNERHIDERSRSPSQRDLTKPGCAAVLLNALTLCLEQMPKDFKNSPAPMNAEITWVTKWVDYSNKYGFGFQLSSDALGVLFNDTSRIIMAPDGRAIQYYDVTSKLSAFTSDCVPDDLERKTTLLQYFARYMDEHLINGGDLEYSSSSDSVSWSGSMFLKKWFRTAKAIVMYLSDGTLQVNFFDDHTKLILSSNRGDYLVTYIDQERVARTYNLAHIRQEGSVLDIYERMTFAKSMLKNLVDIEGADI
ncbi:serine/threonine-protein kinase PLK1 [Biomphalaria glabrata]|uniref:Serine/threonine-protein kinase PLK n=1 Tax=Biomphalaria glabrata TaxID=6526 RepID=A0A2C9JUL0_BIOGL|nr:serine/threonine-protein kinase PLK1-like [Biomphalaria glabrata]XP_013083893.1 serine/threonine-protein kinase PLK1-like [Biomphalaria glabrata]XP_013083894.1 serine/threonine-protein kinase PLK1-like [Biomphalaria glabrata]XP_013083895.1 serine/threonine-protein kinase PLK1-like [Biomphalaria glabrata]KAI8754179.1 serine/threonine-protein kinase PLK1-like [Biomphalaria glabrata]KAI8774007.1 serine/threonine-protein kinase PLK1 [Biomphalaria glabrata]